MISDLKYFVVFLHGLSGSGKGVIHQILVEQYQAKGYEVIYASSGDLFRAALANPIIADQVNHGIFLHTLRPIIPGVERICGQLVRSWTSRDCRAILILDGFIRRTTSITNSGEPVPSQLEEISSGFNNVIQELLEEDSRLATWFPEFGAGAKSDTASTLVSALKGATHILTSIHPDDAERHMKGRSQKQLESIRQQLEDVFQEGQITDSHKLLIDEHLCKLEAILHGGVKYVDGQHVWLPRDQWGYRLEPRFYLREVDEVRRIQNSLAHDLALDPSLNMAEIFESLGISTELRADDIPNLGRKKRIENYIANYITSLSSAGGQASGYEPGFATVALTEDFCFSFQSDGSFSSGSDNCFVVANGQSRGIDLPAFQNAARSVVEEVVARTESGRKKVCI